MQLSCASRLAGPARSSPWPHDKSPRRWRWQGPVSGGNITAQVRQRLNASEQGLKGLQEPGVDQDLQWMSKVKEQGGSHPVETFTNYCTFYSPPLLIDSFCLRHFPNCLAVCVENHVSAPSCPTDINQSTHPDNCQRAHEGTCCHNFHVSALPGMNCRTGTMDLKHLWSWDEGIPK